jgi:hypothetical protein
MLILEAGRAWMLERLEGKISSRLADLPMPHQRTPLHQAVEAGRLPGP